MSQELKDLKIKTNTVKLLLGDLKMSDKEIAQRRRARKGESGRGEGRPRHAGTGTRAAAAPRRFCARRPTPARIAQEAVLAEMVGETVDLLKQRGELDIYMVRGDQRARPQPARARTPDPHAARARRSRRRTR